jgi:hypothetical protein
MKVYVRVSFHAKGISENLVGKACVLTKTNGVELSHISKI